MKLANQKDVKTFQDTIEKCKGDVWLRSNTERYNLKSALSQIVAIGKVISGDESLELFADRKEDEYILIGMFNECPQMI